MDALERYQAVDVAIPSADTIIVTRTHGEDGEFITDVPDRSRLRRGQTPQAFKLSTIRQRLRGRRRRPELPGAPTTVRSCCKYLPDVPIYVVAGDEYNMKVTQPVDVFIADKLFQLASTAAPRAGRRGRLPRAAHRQDPGGLRRLATASAPTSPSSPSRYGAKVYALGRSTTGTHVENPEHVDDALSKAYAETGRIDYVVNTAGVLRIGKLAETDNATIEEALNVNYLAPVQIARAVVQVPGGDQGPAAALHLQQLHPGPRRVQPVLLHQGRHGQPHPGARRRVGRATASGSTASTRSAPPPPCAPRPSARSRRARCSPRRRSPAPRSTCCSPSSPAMSSTSGSRTRPARPAADASGFEQALASCWTVRTDV